MPPKGIVVPHSDFSAVTAVPVGTAVLSGTIPFFVHGSDYLTELQFVNTALHVAVDNSVLGNLAAMHSQPDYAGPSSTAPPPTTTPVGPTAPSGSGSAAPTLTRFVVLPMPLIAGNAGFTTTVTGTDFLPGVSVLINGVPRPTILLTPTTIQVTIPPEDLAIGRLVKVTAMNPSPTVGASNALDLPVMNPVPVALSISPNSADVRLETNAPALPITVSGFGFKQGATILVAGTAIPTTLQNSN